MCWPCRNLVVAMAKHGKLDASAYKVELREPASQGSKHSYWMLQNSNRAQLEDYNNKLEEEYKHELVETKYMWAEDGKPYLMKWWYEHQMEWRLARRPSTTYNVAKPGSELKKSRPPPRGGRYKCRFCGMTNPDHKGPDCEKHPKIDVMRVPQYFRGQDRAIRISVSRRTIISALND